MFNLLVSANDEAWLGEPYSFERGRIFEYTEDAIISRFNDLREDQIERLLSLPSLFAYERPNQQNARVGRITQILIQNRSVVLTYEFDPAVAVVPYQLLDDRKAELDIGDWELNRTHWAVKDVDLIAFLEAQALVEAGEAEVDPAVAQLVDLPPPAPIPISPTAFRIPDEPADPALVSFMMPFSPEFDGVLDAVRAACGDIHLVCRRADEVWDHDEIIQDVFALIYRSRIVVCDFTTQNPNVFYEAGIAHTLGKHVIPITQDIDALPFDLRHRRALVYSTTEEGLADLRLKISARLQRLLDIG